MAELNSLSPYKSAFSRRGPGYQNVPLGDGENETESSYRPPSAGLGLSPEGYEHAQFLGRSPVSPLGAESIRGHSQNQSAQSTPGLNAAGFYSNGSSLYGNGTDTSLVKQHEPPHQHVDCPTSGDILVSPWSWITIFMLFLAFYTFCFSGVFLGIALAKPRWGRRIGPGGMPYSTATLLSALFSKTVELSFVAVLVATIGQILSRRAIARRTKTGAGISIAEMTMRTWILQPGLIFTHGSALKYAGPTLLGALVLIATLAATFYTTAAEALAAPKLKFGGWDQTSLAGVVDTAFANATFLSTSCKTPIVGTQDDGIACLQIDYAGQSYHNFQSYLSNWTSAIKTSDRESRLDQAFRPKPLALVWDNTTISGQWIFPSDENITNDSRNGRLVHNITAAMPHANVVRAARNQENDIAQPEMLEGQGEYFVRASVPAPTINVLCVGMTTDEVKPLIYNPNNTIPHAANATAVDDLFGFGSLEDGLQPAPLFPHLPMIFNTVNNNSMLWGPSAVYLLSTKPPDLETADHVLCSIKMMQYPHCTTKYHASESGGEMSVHCDEDPENTMPYSSTDPAAPVGIYESNWKDVGSEWLKANALSYGASDGNASIARIVTQMTPVYSNSSSPNVQLNPDLPSMAEALAVLAGATAIMSSFNAPFNVTPHPAGPPTTAHFPAAVKFKDYASGGSESWQSLFYVVLFVVFLINLFALLYLLRHLCTDGQVTDYTEPQNMFALAVMSPPSQSLAGSCGAGPAGEAYGKRWKVDVQKEGGERHPHFYVRCTDDAVGGATAYGTGVGAEALYRSQERGEWEQGTLRRKGRVKSMQEAEIGGGGESPALEQYRRLAG
jgi:hypothetical protein